MAENVGEASRRWRPRLFTVVGLLALVWFLGREMSEPSRAFVFSLLAASGSVASWIQAKELWRRSRVALAVLLFVATPSGLVLALLPAARSAAHGAEIIRLAPLGEARGAAPGRVVWVHDPEATDWNGPGHGHWWEAAHTRQDRVDSMLDRAIRELAGETTAGAAWEKLFRSLNLSRGRGDAGYRRGETITVKVNLVGAIFHPTWGGVNPATYDLVDKLDYMNTSPQLMRALLRQLVYVVGVDPQDIAIGDPLSYFPNQYLEPLRAEFPQVRCLDYAGGQGRTRVRRSAVPLFWSSHPAGVEQDYVPASYAEADYLINIANLKSHEGLAGVTLCAKNHFGSLIRWPMESGYFDLHADLPAALPGMGHYRPLVDLMGHADLGAKTVLYLIDGLYAGRHTGENVPLRWQLPPFDGDWTSSLFASQDPVAIDSVGLDFLRSEWEDAPHWPGVDDYLHEAALAPQPPSGTFYDPDHEGDVERLPSLGVHEHWNGPRYKQYSGNLGLDNGIELMARLREESVAIDLGSGRERGLAHPQNQAGATAPARVGQRRCRRTREASVRHFYFAVDDSFAFGGNRAELFATIDFFDAGSGTLQLQYDSRAGGSTAARYKIGGRVKLEDTGTWRRYTFRLTDPLFANRQNAGADFRVSKTGPEEFFYLSAVEVSTAPVPTAVAIDLGTVDMAGGLVRRENAASETEPVRIGGRDCRRNRDPASDPADRHMYFDVDDRFAWRGNRPAVTVTIDYFDAGTGTLRLEYDSRAGRSVAARYKDGGAVRLEDSRSWRRYTFHLGDALFGNRQNAGGDFRISKTGTAEPFYLDTVQVGDSFSSP